MHLIVTQWCRWKWRAAATYWGVLACHWWSPTGWWLCLRCGWIRNLQFICHSGSPSVFVRGQTTDMFGKVLKASLSLGWGVRECHGLGLHSSVLPPLTITVRLLRVIWFSLLASVWKLGQAGCSCIRQMQWRMRLTVFSAKGKWKHELCWGARLTE